MPTALRLIEGNVSRHNERIRPNEPTPVPGLPEPPTFLFGYALDEWNRVAPELFELEVLSDLDQTMLAAYCIAYQQWRHAVEDLKKEAIIDATTHGAVLTTMNGNRMQNPLVNVANQARRDMHRLAAEFGLTPSSRTQINAGGRGDEKDPIYQKHFGPKQT